MRIVFEKREAVSRSAGILVPALSFLTSLALGAILLLACGVSPLTTYAAMARGAFGTWPSLTEMLVKAIPLMLAGLGVAVAFRMRFWNIGAEGQLVLGGVAAAWVALFWSHFMPAPLLLPTVIVAGMIAGALWAGIPALLKAYLRVDETLTTLMLNYVAILFSQNLYYGDWRDPKGYGFPGTAPFPEAAWLPRLAVPPGPVADWLKSVRLPQPSLAYSWFQGAALPTSAGRAHLGLFFAIIAAALLWFVLKRTRWGFELRIIGENPTAARYLGINIARNVVLAMLFSGALAGLAGACEVTGISHRLQQGLSIGYGFTAIIVAWMAQLNPIAVLFVALLMAALLVGGDQVQIVMHLPSAVGMVLQGLILIPMLAGALFTEYRLRVVRTQPPVALAPAEEVHS